MLRWAAIFLILALVAAMLGFGGVAAASADMAKLLFYLFIAVFVVTLVLGLIGGRRPPVV